MLDTASLITALRSSAGAASEVVRLILHGDIVVFMDHKLSFEYRDVALRPEHIVASGLTPQEILTLIELLEGVAEPIRVTRKTRPLSPDPNDDMVLDIAISGAAAAIVTSNVKHFSAAAKRFGVRVLSPAELLLMARGEKDAE